MAGAHAQRACGGAGLHDAVGLLQRQRPRGLFGVQRAGEGLQRQQGAGAGPIHSMAAQAHQARRNVRTTPEAATAGATAVPGALSGGGGMSGPGPVSATLPSTGGSHSRSACASGGPRRFSSRSRSWSGPSGKQRQAQRRHAGLLGRGRLAQQEQHGASCALRGQLQPAQRVGTQARRQPGQHPRRRDRFSGPVPAPTAGRRWGSRRRSCEPACACPRRRSRLFTSSHWRASRPNCASAQAQGAVGRVEQHHPRPAAGPGSQHRRQQAHFAQARVRQQQFGQRAVRPAATGQLQVQFRKTAGTDRPACAAQLVGTPQGRVQGFEGQRQVHPDTVCSYSIDGKP